MVNIVSIIKKTSLLISTILISSLMFTMAHAAGDAIARARLRSLMDNDCEICYLPAQS